MPGRKHLPGATAKQQRQYEHILKSEMKSGKGKKTAKRIAAATTRKRAKKNKASKGGKALKTVGRAAKSAARGILAAGSSILGAGAKALNPRKRSAAPLARWEIYRKLSGKGEDVIGIVSAQTKAQAIRAAEGMFAVAFRESSLTGRKIYIRKLGAVRFDNPRKRRNAEPFLTDHDRKQALQIWDHVVSQGPYKFESQFKAALDRHMKAFGHGSGSVKQGDMIRYARETRGNQWRKAKNKTIIKKAKKVIVLNKGKKKAAKRNPDYPYWNVYLLDTKKTAPYDKMFLGSSSFGATKADAIERFRRSHYPGKLKPGQKIIAEKAVITKNPKRKRNLDHRDSSHQIEVRKHWRAGGLSQWQRAHHAGQHDLFAHGIKAKPKHNPTGSAKDSARWEKLWSAYIKALKDLDKPLKGANARAAQMRLGKAEQAIAKFDPDAYRRYILGAKNPNAARAVHSRKATAARGASSVGRKSRAAKSRKPAVKARKRKANPTAGEIRKEFAGRHTKNSTLYFPDGTPQGLAKLGKLVLIKTESGPIELINRKGEVWLCADTNKRFHLGSTINAPLIDGPPQNFGQVKVIEYYESKPHMGYEKKVIWFHHMGEEGGRRPELISNNKGELKFKGGDYRITTRGIEN